MKAQEAEHSTTRLEAQVRTGGVVSTVVMVWLQVAPLLQPSVARQVRVTRNVWPHGPALVTVETMLMVTLVPSQRSVAVGGMKDQVEEHSTVRSLAQVRIGGVRSTI